MGAQKKAGTAKIRGAGVPPPKSATAFLFCESLYFSKYEAKYFKLYTPMILPGLDLHVSQWEPVNTCYRYIH
jgi:hypothetical protein